MPMQLLRMGLGIVIQQALHVAAKLAIADLVRYERTVEEHRKLVASGGFRLNRTIAVSNEIMILEALPT
jgi:hypothetical protein